MQSDNEQFIFTENARAMIKIQDGCNQFCSYCIIPYARGRIKSRSEEDILKEIELIAKQGIKEIVITGIHIASYGKDLENVNNEQPLLNVLQKINMIVGIERIRLGSLEPTLMTKEFLDGLIKLEKICDHFHLSLQSGCDTVLRRMNRKYQTNEFREIVKQIREYYPNANLTTDIIVGFPGETEEEFNSTYEFLKEIKFYQMHIFKYSIRKGTVAAIMPNQIDPKIKEERSNLLIELSKKHENDIMKNYIDKVVEVLFEEEKDGYMIGHTKNYICVSTLNNEERI